MKALAVFAACLLLAAQQQQPDQPPPRTTFRSAVDLVPVDVNVLDKTGRPVSDLTVDDFTLTVDGRPRRIASAQFISVQRALESAPPKPFEYTSNSGAAGGRLVMIVVDSGNIGVGRGKPAIEAAQRFVAGLNRADRVALVTIPGSGPQLEFTSNHALVQTLLTNSVGQATNRPGPQRVGLSEALNIKRGDQATIAEVADRECGADPTTASRDSCLLVLNNESDLQISQVRERTRNSMIALRHLFDRVATNETPKTLVFLSEGLLLDREQADVAWIGALAAAAHITLYVLQLDSPELEAFSARTSPSRGEDREILRQGLDKLAGMAKGDVFRIVANPDFAFQRLAMELSGYNYLLSFEPEAGDRDGKPHKIKIDVRRKDLLLRARREFSVGAPIMRTTADTVIDTLRAPLLSGDIPLKVTTYTFRDPESPRLKIILAADIDRSGNPGTPISLGYLLLDNKGNVVTSQLEPELTAAVDQRTRTQKYIGAAIAEPGIYTLRLAVVDRDGKRGSVERTFTAKINGFGQLHATDLLIADDTRSSGGALPPAVAADFAGDALHGYIELFSDVPERLAEATVVIEIAQTESGRAIDSVPARFQPVASPNRRVAEAGVPIGTLPAGEYVARAAVMDGGRRIGQVVRPFRVDRTSTTIAAPGSTAMVASAAPIPFVSKTETFDRFSVLTPPVVGFFLERFSATAAASAATVRPAFAYIRAGRYEDALQAAREAGAEHVAASFVRGLTLLNRGETGRLTASFAEALRGDPQFSAAAFYLGASHAAAGNDREAAAAWQNALITDPSAPLVYTVLGDALLRLKDIDRALDVLTEARGLWPADDSVAQRFAAALVTANKPIEAMKVLEPYLATHPADHERLLLALRALYEARSSGRAISTGGGDKALFTKYADAYAAANGPQQALVVQWRQYIER